MNDPACARPPVFDPSAPAFLHDPYPLYRQVRAQRALQYEPLANRWYCLRFADVQALLRSRQYVHDLRKAAAGTASRRLLEKIGEEQMSMLFLDAPEHTRLRKLVNKAFHLPAIEALRPAIQALVDRLLAGVSGQFDVVQVLAAPISTMVIAQLLGIEPGAWQQFKRWSDIDVRGFDPFLTAEEQACFLHTQRELHHFFLQEVRARRRRPTQDLITSLVQARDEHDRLSDSEIATLCQLLLRAGNVSTTDLISNGIQALLEHPAQLALLRQRPALIGALVEETLRYDSPVLEAGRITLGHVTVGQTSIPGGQTVMAALGSANRDPLHVADPERFDLTRPLMTHCSFGAGAHFCLGAPLARIEAQIAIGTFIRTFPALRCDPEQTPQRRMVPSFRGFLSLPVVAEGV